MPIEIDPNTGAPVVKTDDFTPKDESLHPPVDLSTEGGDNTEGTDSTDSTTTEESKDEVTEHPSEDVKKLNERQQFVKEVSDVVQRYTSDSRSHEKCMAELLPIIADKA